MTERFSETRRRVAFALGRLAKSSLYLLLAMGVFALPTQATTLRPMSLAEVKQASASVVQGKVIELSSRIVGSELRQSSKTNSFPPANDEGSNVELLGDDEATMIEGEADSPLLAVAGVSELIGQATQGATHPALPPISASSPETPESLGVEGGMMIFTDVAMRVETAIGHSPDIQPDGTLRYTVAGGVTPDLSMIIHGMPDLEMGGRYIVFLHDKLTERAEPYVGLSQGVFPIVFDEESRREIVTNLSGSPVIALENGQVIVRASTEDLRDFEATWSDPPVPTTENGEIRSSIRDARFWSSDEPALTPDQFMKLVEGL